MDFHSDEHVYGCIPPVLGIATKYEDYKKELAEWEKLPESSRGPKPEEVKPVIIGLKGVSMPEMDEEVFHEAKIRSEKTPEEAQRIIAGFTYEKIKSKVCYIKNLSLDGKEVTDFDTFYKKAPTELVSWVCKAIYSSQVLSRAEIKN